MTATKANYSPEQTKAIVTAYTAEGTGMEAQDFENRNAVVKSLCNTFDRKIQSIRSKLVKEGVYIARPKVSKVTGGEPRTKAVMAQELVAVSGLKVTAGSIEKMTKTDILAFLSYFEAEAEAEALANAEVDENDSQEGESESES